MLFYWNASLDTSVGREKYAAVQTFATDGFLKDGQGKTTKRRKTVPNYALLSGALALISLAVADAQSPSIKPNVILIMTDNQGYGDLGCHGNPIIKTPNLDRLHAESVRMTDFHASSSCTPTRAALTAGADFTEVEALLNFGSSG